MEHRPNPENSVGPLVGIVIIVLILVLGGLYFWGERLKAKRDTDRIKNEIQRTASTTETATEDTPITIPEYR